LHPAARIAQQTLALEAYLTAQAPVAPGPQDRITRVG